MPAREGQRGESRMSCRSANPVRMVTGRARERDRACTAEKNSEDAKGREEDQGELDESSVEDAMSSLRRGGDERSEVDDV